MGAESPNGTSPAPAKKYGITKPISLAGPTDADLQRNAELEKVIFFQLFLWKFVGFPVYFFIQLCFVFLRVLTYLSKNKINFLVLA